MILTAGIVKMLIIMVDSNTAPTFWYQKGVVSEYLPFQKDIESILVLTRRMIIAVFKNWATKVFMTLLDNCEVKVECLSNSESTKKLVKRIH